MPTRQATGRRHAWGNIRTPYLEQFYTAADWQNANHKRRINDLAARIRDGKTWLATIKTTDPPYAIWSRKIEALLAERAVLQRRLMPR
jgi:uncharacterized protein with NAD-binding domain and iron-sulfur cluster